MALRCMAVVDLLEMGAVLLDPVRHGEGSLFVIRCVKDMCKEYLKFESWRRARN